MARRAAALDDSWADLDAIERGLIADTQLPTASSRAAELAARTLADPTFDLADAMPEPGPQREAEVTSSMPSLPQATLFPAYHQGSRPDSLRLSASMPVMQGDDDLYTASVPPPTEYQHAVQDMARQSHMFNAQAIEVLDLEDQSDSNSPTQLPKTAEQRQRSSWSKRRFPRKQRSRGARRASSQALICVLTALLLSSIVATYIVLATSYSETTLTFNVLFILGIILATIVFAHSMLRLRRIARRMFDTPPRLRHKSRRHHRHHRRNRHHAEPRDHRPRAMPSQFDSTSSAFVPAMPIQVHLSADEVRPDSRDAQPTATVSITEPAITWDKTVDAVPHPPPAYGRWRGSVRVDPQLMHWQAIPSPAHPITPGMPSPAYEETVGARPPSYVTRNSPPREREDGSQGLETLGSGRYQPPAPLQPGPEMLESRNYESSAAVLEPEMLGAGAYQPPTAVLVPEMFQVPPGEGVGVAV